MSTNDLNYVEIGNRLREIRKSKGLSVQDASRLCGIAPGTISMLELNRRNPGLQSLVTFCGIYNCSLDEVVFGKNLSSTSSASSDSASSLDSGSTEEQTVDGSEGEDGTERERDPIIKTIVEALENTDETEKDFMARLLLTAHDEFRIVRNKM